jgi:hypothetical protein
MDALGFRQRIKSAHLPPQLSNLTGPSLKLVLERPSFWEHLLFANTFVEEIRLVKEHDWDVQYDIILGSGSHLRDWDEVSNWINKHTSEAERIAMSLANLINITLPDALGPPGVSGDPVKLVYVSRRLADTYKAAVEWARQAKRVSVPEQFQKVVSIVGGFLNTITKGIEDLSEEVLGRLSRGIARGPDETGKIVIDITIDFNLHGYDDFKKELQRLVDIGELGVTVP